MSADQPRVPRWSETLASAVEELAGSDVLRCSEATIGASRCVLVRWDFGHQGGTFGVAEAAAFTAAVGTAIERRLPLVTITRSGGTRLPEGMRALVGIPRAALALDDLRAAGLPHISVADNPTTGGVWVAIGAAADVRIAVRGGIVGFSGPRPVAAMTGRTLAEGANTAEAAFDAGLVDAIAAPDEVDGLLREALLALRADDADHLPPPEAAGPPARGRVRDGGSAPDRTCRTRRCTARAAPRRSRPGPRGRARCTGGRRAPLPRPPAASSRPRGCRRGRRHWPGAASSSRRPSSAGRGRSRRGCRSSGC